MVGPEVTTHLSQADGVSKSRTTWTGSRPDLPLGSLGGGQDKPRCKPSRRLAP